MRLLLLTFSVILLASTSGCLFHHDPKTKSETHMYNENGPSIHFNEENEHAGGPMRAY